MGELFILRNQKVDYSTERGLAIFGEVGVVGGGLAAFEGVATFWSSLLSGFIRGHNFSALLSGRSFFFGSLR